MEKKPEIPVKKPLEMPPQEATSLPASPELQRGESATQELIPSEPKLRYINKALELLKSETGPAGEKIHWRDLYKKVKPFENSIELSDNIREVTSNYVLNKIPELKQQVPFMQEHDDEKLVDALANNWLEHVGGVQGRRPGVVMAVMAQVLKRIETRIYRNIFENSIDQQLEKLGLDNDLRNLMLALLEASTKADPLFVRFLAYSQLSPEPPSEASPVALYGSDGQLHTIASLFPRETKFLSKRFAAIAENSQSWINKPGGEIFKAYLENIGRLYAETDIKKAEILQENVKQLYGALIDSDFPILVTPALEGYYKEPYLDPELRISIASPENKPQEAIFKKFQKATAESLGELNVGQFSKNLKERMIRSVTSIGSFGAGLTFNVPAQEEPGIVVYLNDQLRAYDRDFHKFVGLITNSTKVFQNVPEAEREETMRQICRLATVLHELSHAVYPETDEHGETTQEAKRIGRNSINDIDEVKADSIYRGIISSIAEKSEFGVDAKQWAVGVLADPLAVLQDNEDPDDPYFKAAVYDVNELIKQQAVTFENNQLTIQNFEKLFEILRTNAKKVIELYENSATTPTKAREWIVDNCTASPELQQVIDFLKSKS